MSLPRQNHWEDVELTGVLLSVVSCLDSPE